jgi:hypothetical protein
MADTMEVGATENGTTENGTAEVAAEQATTVASQLRSMVYFVNWVSMGCLMFLHCCSFSDCGQALPLT